MLNCAVGEIPQTARYFEHPDRIRASAIWVDGTVVHRRWTEYTPDPANFGHNADAKANMQRCVCDLIKNGFVEMPQPMKLVLVALKRRPT